MDSRSEVPVRACPGPRTKAAESITGKRALHTPKPLTTHPAYIINKHNQNKSA